MVNKIIIQNKWVEFPDLRLISWSQIFSISTQLLTTVVHYLRISESSSMDLELIMCFMLYTIDVPLIQFYSIFFHFFHLCALDSTDQTRSRWWSWRRHQQQQQLRQGPISAGQRQQEWCPMHGQAGQHGELCGTTASVWYEPCNPRWRTRPGVPSGCGCCCQCRRWDKCSKWHRHPAVWCHGAGGRQRGEQVDLTAIAYLIDT